jgi:VanZ family protein
MSAAGAANLALTEAARRRCFLAAQKNTLTVVQNGGEPGPRKGLATLSWPVRLCVMIAVGALVYWLGTSWFSAARMEPLFYPYFRSLLHAQTPRELFYYLSLVRWTAHFMEYFVLFLLLAQLVGLRPLTALIVCTVLALADEGHQYFLPDRTCSLLDIKFDVAGAFTAFVLTLIVRRLRRAATLPPKPVSEATQGASA